ncbi:hypothetical protein [Nocardia grenadensis]|uniref:hypothetical protein n=1 Tax=Nocardia grenadensis TaxID=931537 RepID=UPI003D72E081
MAVDTVPASAGSKKANRYEFRCKPGGTVYSVPKVQYLSGEGSDFIEEAIKADMTEITLTRRLLMIECPEAADEIRAMAGDQIMFISRRWAEASNITPGESEGSENS